MLEHEPQRELNLSGSSRRSDFPKDGRRVCGGWVIKRHVVEKIEEISAELNSRIFFARQERKVLRKAHVGIEI